jgi:hypothetical protein
LILKVGDDWQAKNMLKIFSNLLWNDDKKNQIMLVAVVWLR